MKISSVRSLPQVTLQVFGSRSEPNRTVVEESESGVTAAAKHSAYHARAMTVVDRRATDTARARDGLGGAADLAVRGLKSQRQSSLHLPRVMPEPAFKAEAVAAEGAERRRVRTPVGVLVSEGDIASSTVRARGSHCSILPAPTASWGADAVTPNCAEVIVSALVEAITGEDIERHTQPQLAAVA